LGKYSEAKEIYRKILQQYPNSEYVQGANLGIGTANIMSLIESGKTGQAQAAITGLVAEFGDDMDLAAVLENIANSY